LFGVFCFFVVMPESIRYRKILIWIVVLNGLVVLASGHGMAFLEMVIPFFLFSSEPAGSLSGFLFPADYEHAFGIISRFAFLGQVLVIIGLCMRNNKPFRNWTLAGVGLLLLSYLYILFFLFMPRAEGVISSACSGLPFVILSIIFLVRVFRTQELKEPGS